MKILVLNAGSSTLKASLFLLPPDADCTSALPSAWEAQLDWPPPGNHREDALRQLLQQLSSGKEAVLGSMEEISVVGHRVVHGGAKYTAAVRLSSEVKAEIARLAEIAPLHNPQAVQVIETITAILGEERPQVAVFDTAFHSTLPPAACTYPGPYVWRERGIRRYGFHGISHQYVSGRTAEVLGKPLGELGLITCHLGNGCSLAAIAGGRSLDTTMGFTPLDGIMMGSRTGALDPGISIYLLRGGTGVEELDNTLNRESGLLGLSGISHDLRKVAEAAGGGNARAQLAIDVFVHSIARGVGGMCASLSGVDALVFTGGIGENASYIRSAVCERLGFLGIGLDDDANLQGSSDRVISTRGSAVKVLVVRSEEDWQIALECRKTLS